MIVPPGMSGTGTCSLGRGKARSFFLSAKGARRRRNPFIQVTSENAPVRPREEASCLFRRNPFIQVTSENPCVFADGSVLAGAVVIPSFRSHRKIGGHAWYFHYPDYHVVIPSFRSHRKITMKKEDKERVEKGRNPFIQVTSENRRLGFSY